MELILENVRSFKGRHEIPIAPLTLMVGENSTGKTAVLGMLSLVSNRRFPFKPDFDADPYAFGHYDTIATKDAVEGTAEYFSLGFKDAKREMVAKYRRTDSGDVSLPDIEAKTKQIELTGKGRRRSVNLVLKSLDSPHEQHSFSVVMAHRQRTETFFVGPGVPHSRSAFAAMQEMLRWPAESLSIAPIRTHPRRVYDRAVREYSPQGEHVPNALSRLLSENTEQTRRFTAGLEEFGKDSGLFEHVRVKYLGESPSDPFQIMVTVAGVEMNLRDVGYGVSQSLPILIEALTAANNTTMLLQQPEVHLHPKAQAALGSLFARLISGGKHIVVETHSDYIIDRVRQEIALKKVTNSDVQVLFFEKQGFESRVTPLHLDAKGNVVDAPESYRRFFLDESMNLFSRTAYDEPEQLVRQDRDQ